MFFYHIIFIIVMSSHDARLVYFSLAMILPNQNKIIFHIKKNLKSKTHKTAVKSFKIEEKNVQTFQLLQVNHLQYQQHEPTYKIWSFKRNKFLNTWNEVVTKKYFFILKLAWTHTNISSLDNASLSPEPSSSEKTVPRTFVDQTY